MLQPKKTRYFKTQRGSLKGFAYRGATLAFGGFGLKAQSRGYLSAREIEAGRRAMTHHLKRGGKIWIRIFPHKPYTKTAAETPMGGGKGAIEYYEAKILPGKVIYEIDGVSPEIAHEALRLAASKLSLRTKIITKM